MVLVANWEVLVRAPCWDRMWEQGLEEMRVVVVFFFSWICLAQRTQAGRMARARPGQVEQVGRRESKAFTGQAGDWYASGAKSRRAT